MDLMQHYINGAWVAPLSEQTFPVINPATETQIGSIILGNQGDVDRAVAAAKAAFTTFSRTSKAERLALLERLLVETELRLEDLAQAMSAEMGAPITQWRATIRRVLRWAICKGLLQRLQRRTRVKFCQTVTCNCANRLVSAG